MSAVLKDNHNDNNDEIAHDGTTKVERYKWADPQKPGKLVWLDKNDLAVDDRYQRDADDAKVLKLASEFNWPAFGVLVVAKRKTGKMFVAEGQHRWLAAMKRADIKKVPCIVFESEGLASEASIFLKANGNRKPVSAVAKFKARLVEKDPLAIKISGLVTQIGRTVGRNSGPSTISCVARIEKVLKLAPEVVERVWPLMAELCAGTSFSERLFAAICHVERHLSDGASLTSKYWRQRLLRIGEKKLVGSIESASAYFQKGGERVWANGVLQAINKGLPQASRLTLPGAETTDDGSGV